MNDNYDVAVIGAGPGGYVATIRTAIAVVIAAAALSGSPVVAATDVYKCDNGTGRLVFSDKPCGDNAEKIRVQGRNLISAPPVEGIRFHLMHGGAPIQSRTRELPMFIVWDDARNHPKHTVRYNPGEDSYSFVGLAAGNYSVNIEIDADRGNPANYPGDYRGHARFSNIRDQNSLMAVHMEKLIHLKSPQDNRLPLVPWGSSCKQVMTLMPGTVLEWESLGPGTTYTFDIRRTECQPFAWKESVFNRRVTDTRLALDLPANRPEQMYTLTVKAHTPAGVPAGTLMTHGLNGYGWDYRFRIAGPPAAPPSPDRIESR